MSLQHLKFFHEGMKKFLLLILSAASMATMSAAELQLVFQTTDGAKFAVVAASASMTVADGNLHIASNAQEVKAIELTKLDKMYFSDDMSGINDVFASNATAAVDVYALNGVYLGTYSSMADATASVGAGVYLFKSGSQTLKISVK
jgi:hypothetical protein